MKRQFLLRPARCYCTILLLGAWCALIGGASRAADEPQKGEATAAHVSIDLAIQKVYPALVRIYVVAAEPGGGRMERMRSAGSGVIVSSEGYVVTNHHVAGNAVRMTCTLADGEEIEAVRVGTDPLADIAVLKLKLETRKHPEARLTAAAWGDSSQLKVGDVVLAMGSPMAISQSVTQGIVSNTQMIMPRSVEGGFRLDGEDVGQIVRWIGHDAVIFGGNSGGPLVNLRGEVVGINEIGLGSLGGAIPSNLARDVANQLISQGRVKRSWIGLEFQPRLKSGKGDGGVLVAGVVEGSPADRAGLKAGDIVTRFGGREVNAELPEHLPLVNQLVFATPVGEKVDVTYLRDGKEQVAQLTTEQLQRALGDPKELKEWGIAVRDITLMMALERHRRSTNGVLVDSVRGGGGAATAKLPLQSEDVILKVNGQAVADVAALTCITAQLLEGKTERLPVPRPLRARDEATPDRRQDRAGGEPQSAGRDQQALVERRHPGIDLGPGRIAGHDRRARRPRERGLQGPGGRQGGRQGGRHHPGPQRQEGRGLATRRSGDLRHAHPPPLDRRQGDAEDRSRRQAGRDRDGPGGAAAERRKRQAAGGHRFRVHRPGTQLHRSRQHANSGRAGRACCCRRWRPAVGPPWAGCTARILS